MTPDAIDQLAQELRQRHGSKSVLAKDFSLQPESEVVYEAVDLQDEKLGRVKINFATEFGLSADPPFEWKLEIDDFQGEHYLWLASGKFVRTERKEFFDVNQAEMESIAKRLEQFLKV